MKPTIRFANVDDVPDILKFITELSVYEKLQHEVTATENDLKKHLFGPSPKAEVLFLELGQDKVGFALFFTSFSTFLGQPGLYLEDLYIRPEFRGRGFGKTLLRHLAQLTLERNCGRLEWSVLDWNTPAIEFYRSLNTQEMKGWTVHRLTGKALLDLVDFKRQN